MIVFYRDSLVPPELCRLLYLTVPEELHVPVVFHNRPSVYVPSRVLAVCYGGEQIHVNLNKIYDSVYWGQSGAAMTVRTWRTLLETCYHEFGHVATWPESKSAGRAYHYNDRVHQYIESLADSWMNQRIAMLLDHDPRLAQPRLITGYLGLRIARRMDQLNGAPKSGSGMNAYVKEVRSRRTGGQLSPGDVLKLLGLPPDARGDLRRVSADIGIEYIDGAGRRHKLYTWGDLRLLEAYVVVEAAAGGLDDPDRSQGDLSDDELSNESRFSGSVSRCSARTTLAGWAR